MFGYCMTDTERKIPIWLIFLMGVLYIISNQPDLSMARMYNLNLAEFTVITFSNQYYFLLIFFPLLFLLLLRLDWTPSISVLARKPKFTSYLKARVYSLLILLLVLLIYHFFLAVAMGITLNPTGHRISGYNHFDSILNLFENQFSSLYIAIGFVLLNYFLGLVCISALVGFILIYIPKKFKIATLLVLYFFIFFGVQRSSVWGLTPFFISNYILLSNAIASDLFPVSLVLMIGITVLVFFFISKRWWRAKSW